MTNIALIVLDTLRKDYFDKHFDWLPGTRFENAWSTSHWTASAHASLFTGKYPSEVPVNKKNEFFPATETSIVERLSESGYRTRGFTSNIYMSSNFNFDKGFDELETSWRVKQIPSENTFNWGAFISTHRDEGPSRYFKALYQCLTDDSDTIPSLKYGSKMKLNDLGIITHEDEGSKRALEFVRKSNFDTDGEFLFLNLMEAHAPYDPPEEYKMVERPKINKRRPSLTGGYDDPEWPRTAYDDAVRYQSDIYEKIFQAVREDFDVVITVGDHGEMLGEDDTWLHWIGIRPEVSHVPLCLSGDVDIPDAESVTSLVDVHATLADLADLDMPSPRGESLLRSTNRDSRLVEYRGLSQRRREVVEKVGGDPDEYDRDCYGIAEMRYHYDTLDGFVGDKEWQPRIAEAVESLNLERAEDDRVSDSVIEHLENLGYA
ncbi:sulfatase-like hydrolase/transferase [Haladaptatus sp.]|uniref:sulfatase-like hydrolase/transferase n=1 Tax=Haladaptatus sp. TaxID=1973141 RepID=UPI003C3333A4